MDEIMDFLCSNESKEPDCPYMSQLDLSNRSYKPLKTKLCSLIERQNTNVNKKQQILFIVKGHTDIANVVETLMENHQTKGHLNHN